MRKNRLIIFVLSILVCVTTYSQKQEGYVKTLGRPNAKGVALGDVTIKIKGEHNPVKSNDDGVFSIQFHNKKNGDAYALQEVRKVGYELNEPEIVGRQFAVSDKVRNTIVMVSTAQLQADKQRIENNANKVAEKNYKQKLALLEKEKEDGTITIEKYQEQLQELQNSFEKYQSLIDGLAEHYAHTDYDELNEKEQEINICIENGELERADSLLIFLFDPIEALKKNNEALKKINQQIADAHLTLDKANEDMAAVIKQQEKDAEHLYQLYTIALSRFDKEKAKFYIVTRAELDTTNVNWQSEAGTFLCEFYDKTQASVYANRAYSCALSRYGRFNYVTARCLNNLLPYIKNNDKKYEIITEAIDILDSISAGNTTKVRNALGVSLGLLAFSLKEDSLALMAFTQAKDNIEATYPNSQTLFPIYNNIGMAYRSLKDYDNALLYHKKALSLAESKYTANHYKVGWAYERIGATLFLQKKYHEAQGYLLKALGCLQPMYDDANAKTQDLYQTLGIVSYVINDWENVYSSFEKVIGEQSRLLPLIKNDSTEYMKILKKHELNLLAILEAMDSINVFDKRTEYQLRLFEVKTTLDKYDLEMYKVATSLGLNSCEKEKYIEAKHFFSTAFQALIRSGNKSYRRDTACHNLYYVYMKLLSTPDSVKYANEYKRDIAPYIDVVLEIDEGETPAQKAGMQGVYHLLRYEEWDDKSLFGVFAYNQTLTGKPKHITVEKDGIIQSYYFENRIGSTIEIKYIDPAEKSAIIEKYESLKEMNHEIF